jgi:hypothetical protein
MGVKIFKVGDLVRLKKSVYEEGVVLVRSEELDTKNYYYVIFCEGTTYEAKPWVRFVHSNELILIEREIHKPAPPSRFKK